MFKRIHPYVKIILTFISVILIGTLCLALPYASQSGKSIGFVDALFTATSATCVTGLSVVTIATDFTIFGKMVMIVLMEIGGLSFITISVFFFTIVGAKIGISNRFLLREQLNQNSVEGLIGLVKRIVIMSFTIQIVFSFINWYPLYLYLRYHMENNTLSSLGIHSVYLSEFKLYSYSYFMSFFHSAASFNNAGFDIFGNESMQMFSTGSTIIPYWALITLNATTMLMIILGGIGFVVYSDISKKKFKWSAYTLHTKLVLTTTFLLIVFGTVFIYLTGNYVKAGTYINSFGVRENAPKMNWMESIFTAITCRTAGFATYDMSALSCLPVTYMITLLLMLIGASPCSTGGGVKTTTFGVIALAIYYFARGKETKAYRRRIDESQISKAFVLMLVAMIIVVMGTALVLIIQPKLGAKAVLFEIVSAFSTTGLSMGITSSLGIANRIIVVFIMFFGRLGPLTIIGVLNKNWMANTREKITYAKENVIIG